MPNYLRQPSDMVPEDWPCKCGSACVPEILISVYDLVPCPGESGDFNGTFTLPLIGGDIDAEGNGSCGYGLNVGDIRYELTISYVAGSVDSGDFSILDMTYEGEYGGGPADKPIAFGGVVYVPEGGGISGVVLDSFASCSLPETFTSGGGILVL
ncbi:hypothetical protein DB346_08130 [Verrucomicrobia bacterium LW23]|nr:hypothetical protein DB346_08130 [Verrucomicrobia bacterium LW23]